MKTVFNIILVLFGIFVIYSMISVSDDDSTDISKVNKTSIENVHINKENKFGWEVKGMVRNNSSNKIKGYVKINFLNSSGDILKNTKTKVNDGSYFEYGKAANFSYYAEPPNFENVTNFDVEFIEN